MIGHMAFLRPCAVLLSKSIIERTDAVRGTKWLSEAVPPEEFEKRCLNLVCAPVGCGKSTWALNELSKIVSKPYKMLYLIDTRNGNNQIVLQNESTAFYSDEWLETVEDSLPWFGERLCEDKIVVMTYYRFGRLAQKDPFFGFDFELILCDEIHSLPKFRFYGKEEPNPHALAQERLEKLIQHSDVLVVGMTATPERVEKWIDCPRRYITVDEGVRQWDTRKTIHYTNQFQVLKQLSPKEKGIVFFIQVSTMLKFQEAAIEQGFHPICIWSRGKKDPKMNDEQIKAIDYILAKEELPPQYDMVIINASSETGINIRGQVDYIMIHTRQEETRIQVRGRYRGDLDRLYLLDSDGELFVPEEYLDRRLFKEGKDKLCEILNIRDNSNHLMKWPTVKAKLIQAGYCVKDADNQREKNRRYAIISV